MKNQWMDEIGWGEPIWCGAEPLLTELSGYDREDSSDISISHDTETLDEHIPEFLRRKTQIPFSSLPEPVIARHFGRLARRNHSLHHGGYPLGSCTMKYNPAANEYLAQLEGFTELHPYQDEEDVQGALQLMWELEQMLNVITGMEKFSLQPAAGAHGEWAGLSMIRAYHEAKQDFDRTKVLIPDSAHGTNPASAALCGLEVIPTASQADGTVNIDELSKHLDSTVAAIMLTNPNTLGVFEKDIMKIARRAHDSGALLYYDGANLNALVGVVRPGDMGFDVVHLNLHKTFSTPHGGGGPGAGPVGVRAALSPFLPIPTVEHNGKGFYLDYGRKQSIGKVRSYYGNFGVLVRAYAYIRSYGNKLPSVAYDAVLNAQYLKSLLALLLPEGVSSPTLHEFILTTRNCGVEGLRALDFAKRMIDYGVHPPTMYFPMTVPEALMFEPTETESRKDLDVLAKICKKIMDEAKKDLGWVQSAPHNAPVSRVDEVAAARNRVLSSPRDKQQSKLQSL